MNIHYFFQAALGPISVYSESSALRSLFSPLKVTLLLQIADALQLIDALGFARSALRNLLLKTDDQSNLSQQIDDIDSHEGTEEYTSAHQLMVEVLVSYLHRRPNQLSHINRLPLFPTESLIWDPNMVPTEHYQGDFSLALPKLNLQFLTIRDYLLRNFQLFRLESTYEIREDLEDAVFRMKPLLGYHDSTSISYDQQTLLHTQFRGKAKMASPIDRFAIILVKAPALGSDVPLEIRAEISIDLKKVPKDVRREWDSLRQYDVLFLLAIRAPMKVFEGRPQDLSSVAEFPEKFGVLGVRGCEIVEVLDEEGQSISEPSGTGEMVREPFGDIRTFRVLLDSYQYQQDLDEMTAGAKEEGEETLDIYSALNLVVRRKPAENNFKVILQTIRQLMNDTENAVIPSWLHDLFLGYGDPTSAQYFNLPTEISTIDFADTFLDFEHIKESFPKSSEVRLSGDEQTFSAPCRISFEPEVVASEKTEQQMVSVHPYTMEKRGPYPQCEVKKNKIRSDAYSSQYTL